MPPVRSAVVIGLVLIVTGCRSEHHARVAKVLVCGTRAPGETILACGWTPNAYHTYAIYDISRPQPRKVAGAPPGGRDLVGHAQLGFWVPSRVFVAPDGKAVLAQWSGECEGQSTYLISRTDGRIRPVFRTESHALGWSRNGRARVFLAERDALKGEYAYAPGVYLVDPRTMKPTLVRRVNSKQGC
jgi:hypothetical protein